MIIFSQQDPRWVSVKYNNGYTIGRYGCTLTDLTMIKDWFFGEQVTPPIVASKLKYTTGLIIWQSLPNVGLKLIQRIRGRDDNAIRNALAAPDQCVILEVNNNHWLWAIGRQLPVLGYKVVDPWSGSVCYTNKYKNNITGCAIIGKA